MKTTHFRTSLLALAAAALISACGGGDEASDGATAFAGRMRAAAVPTGVATTTAATATTVTATMVLDWAEFKFPDLFPKAIAINYDPVVYEGVTYTAREYRGAWGSRYLGVTPDGRIFGLGDFTNNALQQFDDIPTWSAQILADQCNVYPGSCGNPPAGPLNECVDPAAATLPTGLHIKLIYETIGNEFTGEQTSESVINGPDTFKGQSAIKITTTSNGTAVAQGFTMTTSTTVESFEQIGGDGVTLTLGAMTDVTTNFVGVPFPPSRARAETVYDPPRRNLEFHIALGETGSVTATSTTTTFEPVSGQTTTTDTDTFTFEAKEEVTVPAGTYLACRYRMPGDNANSHTTTWYMVGKGVPVKTVDVSDGETTTMQLKPGSTYNGAPL